MSDRVQGNWQTDGHTYRRMELTTGTPRRRSWTLAEKARIVAESYSGDRPVAEVALRHSIHRNQIGLTPVIVPPAMLVQEHA